MALTADKYILPNGTPAAGKQPTKSSSYGDVEVKALVDNDAGYTTNTGDMVASTYDPSAIGGDAFLLSNMKMTRNDQTGTTYTLLDSDHGKVVTLNNASAITLTVPSGLRSDFNCVVIQKGDGVFTITESGTTVGNRQGHTDSAGKYASVSIVSLGSEVYVSQGDTA